MQETYVYAGKKYINPAKVGVTRADEKNDCVLRAIANLDLCCYDTVHLDMKLLGRKKGKGVKNQVWIKYVSDYASKITIHGTTNLAKTCCKYFMNSLDCEYSHLFTSNKGCTIENALNMYSKGRFIFLIKGHAFAVIDGKIYDKNPLVANTRIVMVIEIKKGNL